MLDRHLMSGRLKSSTVRKDIHGAEMLKWALNCVSSTMQQHHSTMVHEAEWLGQPHSL